MRSDTRLHRCQIIIFSLCANYLEQISLALLNIGLAIVVAQARTLFAAAARVAI